MNIFDISLDDDINYLLQEIGHNCKINNQDAKAILNNTRQERIFDDKIIITDTEIVRGDYFEINDMFFLVLPEINNKRYNSYYKSIIRRCNFDVKFIIDDRLYLFPSIIEGDKFSIEKNIISVSADHIIVTLPSTNTTRQIKKQDAFIKWGQKWSIEGIDYTKDGLIVLHCKQTLANTDDDIENEIAERWDDNIDKLDGNIEPILPFDDEDEEPEKPQEPTDPTPTEPEEPTEAEYTISGRDYLYWDDVDTYTINKTINDEVIGGNFTFDILQRKYNKDTKEFYWVDTVNIIDIQNTTDNSITIKAIDGKRGYIKIIATDVDTEGTIEKEVRIMSMMDPVF